jgi:hypothetical protein
MDAGYRHENRKLELASFRLGPRTVTVHLFDTIMPLTCHLVKSRHFR